MQPVLHPRVFQHCLHQSDLNGLERVSNNLNKALSQIKLNSRIEMCFPARQQGPALLITHGVSPWLHMGLSRCLLLEPTTLNTTARPRSLQKRHPSPGTQCHACFLPVCDTKPTENISPICFIFLACHPNAPHRLEIQNMCGMQV